jgi:hypothetical protein
MRLSTFCGLHRDTEQLRTCTMLSQPTPNIMENVFIQSNGIINVTIQPTKEKLKGVMPTAENVITSFYFF